jgi:ABC-2 type transport system ATP-binding protein
LISGLRFPTNGSLEVFGHLPSERNIAFLQETFFIAEEPYIPAIKLETYVKLYAPFYPKFDLVHFFQLLNEFDISKTMHFKNASMGQKKKAIIAFALACNTRLLIMDEPTNGLDIPSKRQFRKILAHIITDDRIFIISTHQVRDLHSLIDTVVVLDEGKIIFNESIGSISDRLSFVIRREPPEDGHIIYYERVPGGYLCLSTEPAPHALEADIEILFNAVTTETKAITNHFNTEYA